MIETIKKTFSKFLKIKEEKLRGKMLIIFILAYFVIVSFFMLKNGMWLSPDQFIIVGFVLALLVAQPILFLRDWTPFILLFLSYEYLRGLAPKLGMSVHIYPMIHADKFLFLGTLPTVDLQKLLYVPGQLHFYDYIFTVLYMMHFILPLVFAFFLWIKRRKDYKRFVIALLALSYAGFLTYMLFPAMPPWMASDQGIIPQVYNTFGTTMSTFVKSSHLPSVYKFMNPNPVAAMPSLHAAYPTLVFLFLLEIYGRKAWAFIIYPIAVWVAIVYTGNHYVIDAIFGILYAYVAFYGVNYFYKRRAEKVLVTETA